ncbi:hypothetical protein [Rhizorhabdus sp.]|uniref:HNH endonuclease n=1 Tax=Rhizorhabdus sp. TaxID=1968843 RepID=UPI00198E0BE8|nr:hypothetical protein [Rhizorhabdus sp.]MBD3762843.1 hypothetical protein [Rhizorhabdus sp.]
MTAFRESELAEMNAQRAILEEPEFNAWFDKSDIKARIKKAMMHGQRLRCCYCRRFQDTTNNLVWDLEHILCELHYPQFFAVAGNLAIACKQCNNAKKQADVLLPQPRPDPRIEDLPTASASYSIPHPRLDSWSDWLRHTNFQVYSSETDKGLELIKVCKLNEPGTKKAGLSYDQVVAAIKTRFFERMGNPVEDPPPDEIILARVAGIVDDTEEMRIAARLQTLAPELRKMERKADRKGAALTSVAAVGAKQPRGAMNMLLGPASRGRAAPAHPAPPIQPLLALPPPAAADSQD